VPQKQVVPDFNMSAIGSGAAPKGRRNLGIGIHQTGQQHVLRAIHMHGCRVTAGYLMAGQEVQNAPVPHDHGMILEDLIPRGHG